METGRIITESAYKIYYKNLMDEKQKYFKARCQENLIDYFPIVTDQSLELFSKIS